VSNKWRANSANWIKTDKHSRWYCRVYCPTRHITGHFGNERQQTLCFLTSDCTLASSWPTSSLDTRRSMSSIHVSTSSASEKNWNVNNLRRTLPHTFSCSPGFLVNPLKMICNYFLTNWLKVVSSCLLQYKPVCVTNFDKLRREMLQKYKFIGLFGIVILWLFPSRVTSYQDTLILFASLCVWD